MADSSYNFNTIIGISQMELSKNVKSLTALESALSGDESLDFPISSAGRANPDMSRLVNLFEVFANPSKFNSHDADQAGNKNEQCNNADAQQIQLGRLLTLVILLNNSLPAQEYEEDNQRFRRNE